MTDEPMTTERNRGAHARSTRPGARVAVAGLVAVAVVAGAAIVYLVSRGADHPTGARFRTPASGSASAAPSGSAPAAPGGSGGGSDTPDGGVPQTGPGTFGYAAGGPVVGAAGTLHKYQLAVENDVGQDLAAFTAAVDAVLTDPRGWTGGNEARFQRVAKSATADFTIMLATPGTTESLCAAGGLHTRRYTSCRIPGKVVINLARWAAAVPGYGAPLEVYRAFALNHEIGHELGGGHEACPGRGQPAPVMQQQTLGLGGCVANAWPYLDGKRHSGAAVP